MTTKEKYELIDKTKVNEKILTILRNMEQSSSNFTNEAVNSKIDVALEKLIEQIRAVKPEALLTLPEAKKEVKKEKEKAIKKNKDKDLSEKKDTDDETGLPKKDTIEERKDIIKEESETEKEARDRAKKELEKENEKAKDEVESQIEKLNRLILEDPALQGFNTGSAATGGGRSTPIIDAERKALPRGSRISQKGWMNQYGASNGGRKYWENRENRSDRKSPDYETGKPYLAKGGNVYSSDEMYQIAMVKGDVDLDTISIRAKNKAEARMIFEDTYREKYEDKLGDFAIEIYLEPKMAKGGETGFGSWESLTIEKMQKDFPFDLNKLNRLLKDACENRDDADITNFQLSWMSKKYDTFAQLVYEAGIYLKSTGSDNVSPSGTYHSQKGLSIIFYLRQTYQSDGSMSSVSIDSQIIVAGGMGGYKSKDVENYYDIYNYISSVLRDNPKNNLGKFTYAEGGEVEGVDLFEDYDDQPEEVQAILANYEMEDNDYETLQNLKAELESIGYTMDFGLDAEPYDLRKIGQTGKSEFYAKGGKLNTEVILTENRSNGAKWRGVVKPFMMKSIERNQYAGGFKRYEIDIYDDVEREPSKEELKQANEFFDKVGGRFAKGGMMADGGETKDYYENLAIYVRGLGEIYRGKSMKEALAVANNYKRKNTKAKIVVVDDKIGDEYDLDGNLTGIQQRWYLMYAKGGETDGKYTEYEMVVLSKDTDGKSHKYRFLISARNIDEAKQTATDGWHSEFGDMGETFYKVMTDSKYRMEYMTGDGGGVPYKPYGKTKGRFKLTYEIEGEPQSEIRQSLEEAKDSAKRYSSPKLGYTNVHIYDESGKEYFFADGGEVEPKIYEINDGFHLYYFYGDNKAQVLKYFKMAYDTNKYEQNISIRIMTGSRLKHLEESEEYNYIEDARVVDNINEGIEMADGGEVDFEERMAKMRSAYENLNMIVKSKIAMAVGIDRAISIMENDYSIDPFGLITSAVRGGLLELDEINKDLVNEAVYEAENVTDDYRDSGQGISGSDMTAFTKNVLDSAGYKTGFINNRLERVDDEGNKLEIDKYEMNY